jgi:HlyD family secretion protein
MEKPSRGGDPVPAAKPVRVKTGISDGVVTEIMDGLNEGDVVIIGVKPPPGPPVTTTPSPSPFGSGGGRRGF